jgi:uncharacterized membrane protein
MMTVGPIQLIAIGFEDFEPTGKILPALNAAVASGAIRLIDLQFVGKDVEGNITSMEMSGLSPNEQIEFGAVIGGLLGAGLAGEEGAEVGALEGALAAAGHSYGLTAADVQDIADGLMPGDAAALLMIEHTWATGFRDAVGQAGGMMLGQGFLTPGTLLLIGAELAAQAEALAAIEEAAEVVAFAEAIEEEAMLEAEAVVEISEDIEEEAMLEAEAVVEISEAIEEEAMLEAAEAVAMADAIKAEAARQAVEALIAAELIEEAAIEEALEVVAAAMAVEEAALDALAAGESAE